jgi:hypothetical protein
VGTKTDAALAQVVAARADFDDELDRLEAAGRAAVDIPAKVRRQPVKAAGVVAGAAFVAVGGPRRLFRRAKRAVWGKEEPLPEALLPDEIEKAVRRLGSDGEQVRGTLEREFAKYLKEHEKERKQEGLRALAATLAVTALRPAAARVGWNLADRALNPNPSAFKEQMERILARRGEQGEGSDDEGGPKSGVGI